MKNKLIVLFLVLLLTVSLASAVEFPEKLGKYKLEKIVSPIVETGEPHRIYQPSVTKKDGSVVPIKAIYKRGTRRTYLDSNGNAIAWSSRNKPPKAFKVKPGKQDRSVQSKLASFNSPKAGTVKPPKGGKGPTTVSYKDGNGESQIVNIAPGITVPKGVKNVKVSKDGNAQVVTYDLGTGANKKSVKISTEGAMSVVEEGGEVTQFAFAGKPITKDTDGTWKYNGATYQGVKADGGKVTLNTPGKSVELSSANGVAQEVVKQGDVTTTTQLYADGGRSITVIEGKKGTTNWYDNKRNLVSRNTNDGKTNTRIFYDNNRNPIGSCNNCNQIGAKPTVTFDSSKCTADQYDQVSCYTQTAGGVPPSPDSDDLKGLQDAVYNKAFNEGSLSSQAIQGAIFGGNQRFNALPLSQHWEFYRNWTQNADNFFSTSVLGTEYYESLICEQNLFKLDTGENIAVIKTSGDTVQFIGHIEAERMDVSPLICQPDEEGELVCPGDLTCGKDSFCYEDGKDKPADGFLYKLSWGVTAPADEKFLQYSGQAGSEIKFNIKAESTEGDFYLFQDAEGIASKQTIHLKKGQRSEEKFAPMIVDYSTVQITKFCIEFADGHRPADLDGEPVNDLCTKADDAARKRTLAESTGGSPSNTGEVKFCGFSKCN